MCSVTMIRRLTVLCVDASTGNFIQDHVLRTTWETALDTGTHTLLVPKSGNKCAIKGPLLHPGTLNEL